MTASIYSLLHARSNSGPDREELISRVLIDDTLKMIEHAKKKAPQIYTASRYGELAAIDGIQGLVALHDRIKGAIEGHKLSRRTE